jgi:RNA polymerase sigma-32 factor
LYLLAYLALNPVPTAITTNSYGAALQAVNPVSIGCTHEYYIMGRHNVLNDTIQSEDTEYRREEYEPAVDGLNTYLSEVRRHSLLGKGEEAEIAERAHRYKNREAVDRLITSNLRLVVKIALEYHNPRYDLLDLIQQGNEGLVRAARKFNPYKGTKFSTYASFWIKAYVLKHFMDSWSLVKVGTTQNQRRLFYQLSREKKRLLAQGVEPLPRLVAEALGVKTRDVESMEKRLFAGDVSLDSPLHDEGDETVMNTITTGDDVEETVADREEKEILKQIVSEFRQTLNEKEVHIFDRRILSEEPATLQDIATQYGISRERVRQLECRVVKRVANQFELKFKALGL